MVKVASKLGSHSRRHARQRCFLGYGRTCEGWCIWTLSFLYCSGMVCRAMTRRQNLGLQYVWVQTGVLGRRDWGHGPCCWARVQGPNESGYLGAV